jgi:hypothetical protein
MKIMLNAPFWVKLLPGFRFIVLQLRIYWLERIPRTASLPAGLAEHST